MPNYQPEPVPSGNDVEEVQRYLTQELHRIAAALNIKTERSYGGIFQTSEVTITPLDATPVLFNPFDSVIPVSPEGVEGVPASGTLIILTGGSYMISFTTTVIDITPNSAYGFLLALNGASTALGGTIEPSNQTEQVTVSFNILFDAVKGDFLTMLINSVTNSDATVVNSEFIATRVSESFD